MVRNSVRAGPERRSKIARRGGEPFENIVHISLPPETITNWLLIVKPSL